MARRSQEDFNFPAAPTGAPPPPAPTAAPAPSPYPVGGTGSDAAVNEANTAYNSGQRGSDPNAIFGAGGASNIRNSAAGQSEDMARFSDPVLAQWEQYRVPGNGKPQYRSMRGAPGLFDKPTECPPGQGPSGPNETDPCTTQGYSEGGGGGGGSAGGAGGGGGSAGGGGDASGLSSMMETNLKGMLAGGTRYDPATMQGLLAQIKQRIESSKGTQLRQAESEAAGRGMSRSGKTGTNLAAIRRGAETQFTGEYANTLRAKIDADRQDRLDALDRSQKYLDSMRDELYRRDMSAIQRQQFKANLDLAYANIKNQRETLASQQQYGKDMLGAQYGYQATFGG